MRDHEVHDLGRGRVSCGDEIAFIFPILGIDDDHDLASANGSHGGIDRGKATWHGWNRGVNEGGEFDAIKAPAANRLS